MTVFLKDEISRDEEAAIRVLCRLENTKLKDIMVSSEIIFEPDVNQSVIEEDREFLSAYFEIAAEGDEEFSKNLSPWVLRIVLDQEKVCRTQMTMDDISARIRSHLKNDILCLHSDDNSDHLILRLYLRNNAVQLASKASEKGKAKEAQNNNSKSSKNSQLTHSQNKNRKPMYLRNIESSLLSQIPLKGITNLSRINLRQTNVADGWKLKRSVNLNGEFEKAPEWILETEGSSLLHVLGDRGVDSRRTYSNDIWDTFVTLGVEAARKVIEIELRSVLQTYGLYVNYRHVSLLCDVMTCKGVLMPITRHGVGKQEAGPLMRCSFEETADVLIDAAVHSERDYIRGVSENIIVGQIPKMGTGCFDLILDVEKCKLAKEQVSDTDFPENNSQRFSPRPSGFKTRVDLDAPKEEGTCFGKEFSTDLYTPADVCYKPMSPTYSPVSPTYAPAYAGAASSPPYGPAQSSILSPTYSPVPVPLPGSETPFMGSTSSYVPQCDSAAAKQRLYPVPRSVNLPNLDLDFDFGFSERNERETETEAEDRTGKEEELVQVVLEPEKDSVLNTETLDPSFSPFALTFATSSTEGGYKPNF